MLDAAISAMLYAAVLLITGSAAAYWVVVPHSAERGSEPEWRLVEHLLGMLGLFSSLAALAALVLRAWTQTAAAFGWPASVSMHSLAVIMFESRWGKSWQWQMAAAVACAVAYALAGRKGAWLTIGGTSLLLTFAVTLTGHAAGSALRSMIQATHLIGAGVWLGTLAALAVTHGSAPIALRNALFRRFSPLAMTGAALLAGSGLAASWLYLGSLANLWNSPYGRVLLLKIVFFCGVLACGIVNWKHVRSLHAVPGYVVRIELSLAAGVVAITGFLTGIAHP